MKIYFYQAECGDAARISYKGESNQERNIFIDSGYERTFRHIIGQEIEAIISNKKSIDLWIISHIHDDHIGGVIKYISAIKNGEFEDIVEDWYYNTPRTYILNNADTKENVISEIKSIDQGDKLYSYLKQNTKVKDFDIVKGDEYILDGMKIQILSPSYQKLNNLRDKYFIKAIPLERNENDNISEIVKSTGYDYNINLEQFNLDVWSEDDSIENGSSISLLTEINGKKILWLADAHPTDVVDSLKKLGYSEDNKIACDFVKVTHHGSKANNSNELYSLIDCENYLMSVNGENINYLPTKESMARIIRNENRKKDSRYKFYFTYDNATLRKIFTIDGEEIFGKWNFEVYYLSDRKYYEFQL